MRVLALALALGAASQACAGEGQPWSVGKTSGEVWMVTTGAQQVSLGQQDVLKPGDSIRTGRNGRVLLVRGEETILVSPNSVIGLPTESKDGLSTTIVQQAGSILLEVEKRNVKHFEVETPYLAAVVKGTRFRVSVNAASTRVDVVRGQVEVADFRSGQVAQVMPGQVATASAHGKPGVSLSGSGTFSPIEQGRPRASTIPQIMIPKSGLSGPRQAANGQPSRATAHGDHAATRINARASLQPQTHAVSTSHGVTRISTSLGEVRLNFHKVTHGLARDAIATSDTTRSSANKDTVWNSSNAQAVPGAGNGPSQGNSNDSGNGNGNGNGNGGGNGATGMNAAMSGMTAAAAGAGNRSGNGNAASDGENGSGNGATGRGRGSNGDGSPGSKGQGRTN
jgi:FecR-like protein